MDVNFKDLSMEERTEFIEDLRRKRHAAMVSDTLKVLSARSIAKNHSVYFDRVENPLRVLPNTLIQYILEMIKEVRHSAERLVPKYLEEKFVLLLLNGNLTEFNPNEFNPYSRSSNAAYYKHIVENCPNMIKVIRGQQGRFSDETLELPLDDIFKWKNIKYIGFKMCICRDEHLRQLLEHVPNLEGMEITVSGSFTSEGVLYLSQMKNLKHLNLSIAKEDEDIEFDSEILVQCAGSIPSLQSFQFSDSIYGPSRSIRFLELFAQQYPLKKLTVPHLRLTLTFETDWPANLVVERLTIQGKLNSTTVAKICAIPCHIKELTFDSVSYRKVYAILNSIGHRVQELHFVQFTTLTDEPDEHVNLFTIIAACPNLEKFRFFSTAGKLETVTNFDLPLEYFRNWKAFDINDPRDFEDVNDETFNQVDKLLKLFLLGNKSRTRTLHLHNLTQIKTVEQVLKENPACLEDLEKLTIDFSRDGMLETALKVSKQIIFISPRLKKIKLKLLSLDPHAIPNKIRKYYDWFNVLVKSAGVRFKCVCEMESGKDDSSYEQFTDFEDSDDSYVEDDDDDDDDDDWDDYDGENEAFFGFEDGNEDDDDELGIEIHNNLLAHLLNAGLGPNGYY
ncbi:uncharacterized protein LOC135946700 [Cloeon dipterum]|uniref:uncharacterized protein LOC135946700 n=1 Tax=Cloeon dipterum TaxID=197152 RepID=UPI00321FC9A7